MVYHAKILQLLITPTVSHKYLTSFIYSTVNIVLLTLQIKQQWLSKMGTFKLQETNNDRTGTTAGRKQRLQQHDRKLAHSRNTTMEGYIADSEVVYNR